ncbi:fibrinogen-like protein A [Patiria miniata]|uniref:Fibrinogen C-terminal domain-containing protein n=1 Tax=Patiria miniata TaxID=46514 RepID=A0A914A6S3_PATMI|nr:fibrinogen-like protein A [Patiria miniata]
MATFAPQLQVPCFLQCVILAFAAVAVTTISAIGTLSCSHQVKKEFLPAVNRRLHVAPYRQTLAKSHVLCVRDCHADSGCLSVNYLPIRHICHLNNSSREEHPGSFGISCDSVHFDADALTPSFSVWRCYCSCKEFLQAGHDASGIYTIFPASVRNDGLQVYCDMETDAGGWIVIQRRQDGSVNFYRDWADYQVGFGNFSGEFWIGNDILRNLTALGTWQLRVDLVDWDNVMTYAEYGQFGVSGTNYQLTVGSYNDISTAKDALTSKHNGMLFSTWDKDNDNYQAGSCAQDNYGAWWYDYCYLSNLNGKFYAKRAPFSGLPWNDQQGQYEWFKKASMKIRQYP